MQFNHIILQITDTCPLQCAYCCVESGPWRTTSMAYEDAVSYLRQAKEMNPDAYLSFTGGEPFSRWTLHRDIARYAHDLGMWHTTITSAVWCKSPDFARERLAELQRYGLRTLSISYDSFHEPWVTPEKVQNCIVAAADLGLDVTVAGSMTKESKGARELLGSWLDQYQDVRVANGPVQPTGRGALIPLESLLVEDWGEANLACPVVADLMIQTDGTVYPCCSTGGDYDYLRLGNARETPLAEIRARLDASTWYRIITKHGFLALEAIVRRYEPDTEFPRSHIGVCNLCSLVFGPGEISATVRRALARYDADRTQSVLGVLGDLAPVLEPAIT
ncbi:MAG: radical SAM/SPASM domain-containing protein [Dehalococcoidia bacterium]